MRLCIEFPGIQGGVVAPIYKTLSTATIPELKRFLPEGTQELKGEGKFILPNGSEIHLRTADLPDNLRGPTLGFVWIDEGADVSAEAFKILVGRLRQPDMPCKMWVTTTPKGMVSWVYEYFVDLPTRKPAVAKLYWCVQYRTQDNPHLPEGYVESMEMSWTGLWAKQELGGEFVGFEGIIYDNFEPSVHTGDFQSVPLVKVYYCHDFGMKNPHTCMVLGVDADDTLYVVDEYYASGETIEDLIEARRRMQSKWGPGIGLGDPSRPDSIASLCKAGLYTEGANNEKLEGIQTVHRRFSVHAVTKKPSMFVDQKCFNFIWELKQYHWQQTKEGKPMKDVPEDVNNHASDAIRYGVMRHDSKEVWSVWNNEVPGLV